MTIWTEVIVTVAVYTLDGNCLLRTETGALAVTENRDFILLRRRNDLWNEILNPMTLWS